MIWAFYSISVHWKTYWSRDGRGRKKCFIHATTKSTYTVQVLMESHAEKLMPHPGFEPKVAGLMYQHAHHLHMHTNGISSFCKWFNSDITSYYNIHTELAIHIQLIQLRLSLQVKTFDRRHLSAKSTMGLFHYELFMHACEHDLVVIFCYMSNIYANRSSEFNSQSRVKHAHKQHSSTLRSWKIPSILPGLLWHIVCMQNQPAFRA
jgi:hypothetical protein